MLEKHRKFAINYAATGNGAEAARLAGYSPQCARQTAYRLKKLDHIQQAIDRELWFVGRDLRSTKAKATELLIESFHRAESATEMRKSVDALCKLHGLIK